MATDVETVRDELKVRLRVTTQSISDANSYDIMDKVQKTLNYALQRRVTTGTLTETTGTSVYYTTTSIAADCLKVISMHEAGSSRTVMPLDSWRDFWHYDRSWYRSTAGTVGRVEAWAHVGHNMIAIYPGASGTVSCVYLQDTTTLNSSADNFYLDDKDIDLVYDLCEIVWHLHLRNYPELKIKLDTFTKTIAPYIGGE
jgi:hypothetical protein